MGKTIGISDLVKFVFNQENLKVAILTTEKQTFYFYVKLIPLIKGRGTRVCVLWVSLISIVHVILTYSHNPWDTFPCSDTWPAAVSGPEWFVWMSVDAECKQTIFGYKIKPAVTSFSQDQLSPLMLRRSPSRTRWYFPWYSVAPGLVLGPDYFERSLHLMRPHLRRSGHQK